MNDLNTQLMQATPQAVELAGQLLREGQVVAIPTETVYGLAASSLNGEAVKKIFSADFAHFRSVYDGDGSARCSDCRVQIGGNFLAGTADHDLAAQFQSDG